MGDLSQHFSRSEFQCPCCGVAIVDIRLPMALEKFRALVGEPVIVDQGGGYRCESYNQQVGGTANSMHLFGKAADIHTASGLDVQEMYRAALGVPEFKDGGIGIYSQEGFIHVDIRDGWARWARLAPGQPYVDYKFALVPPYSTLE